MVIEPKGIIIHSMGEFINDGNEIRYAKDWLNYLKLSAHSLIKPNGDEDIMVEAPNKALHAGISQNNGLSNLNNHYLGIEVLVEGIHDFNTFLKDIKDPKVFKKEQYITLVALVKKWMEKYNIPLDNIVRHSSVSGDDIRGKGKGKVDPGSGFEWNKFLSEL